MKPGCATARVLVGATVAVGALSLVGCSDSTSRGASPLPVKRVLGEVGISPGQFAFPRCLDSDRRSLWVIDKTARVQRLDPASGRAISGWRMPEIAAGKPTGLAVFDPSGRDEDVIIFIPDTHYHRVLIYRPGADGSTTNEPIASFGSYGIGPGQFIYLTDVAVLPAADGKGVARLYVSEYGGNDRVSMFEPDASGTFRFVGAFGTFGDGASAERIEFSRPQSMEIDASRKRLVVTDACNHRIGVFDLEGRLLRWIPGKDARTADQTTLHDHSELFRYPYGLVLLKDGSALVSEQGAARITRVDLENGRVMERAGKPGRDPGELVTPWGVTVRENEAFALDSGNNRIVCFDAEEGRLKNTGPSLPPIALHSDDADRSEKREERR